MKLKDLKYYIAETTDIVPSQEYPNTVSIQYADGTADFVHTMHSQSLCEILRKPDMDSEMSVSTIEFDRCGISTVIVFPE